METEPSVWLQIWTQVQPAVVSIAVTIITAVAGIVGIYLRKKLSDESMEILQTVFQKGIENAAGVALNLLDPRELTKTLEITNPAIREGVDYVKRAVPDTIGAFKLTDNALAEKIIAKIMVMTAARDAIKAPTKTPAK